MNRSHVTGRGESHPDTHSCTSTIESQTAGDLLFTSKGDVRPTEGADIKRRARSSSSPLSSAPASNRVPLPSLRGT